MTEHFDIPVAIDIDDALKQCGFHFRKKLGSGAFGEVSQVKRKDGKSYAIKIVKLLDKEIVKYNKRELDLLTKLELSEDNVIKYFQSWKVLVGGIQRLQFIQMELCLTNLEDFIYVNSMGGPEIIKADGPPRFYQKVFPQILNGLDAIHSNGWVHRDLHLRNILIANPNPQHINDILVKVADFGLARYIGKVSETFNRQLDKLSADVGHMQFRAPELSTAKYDFKVDLYSSGIILYLLNCYLPRERVDDEISALRRTERTPENLHHQDDEQVNKLIHALLQKEPDKRPTASEALICMPLPTSTITFMVKKCGHGTYYRCSSNDTLSSLKQAIEEHPCIRIEANLQDLRQESTDGSKVVLSGITSDRDVREMRKSAEKKGNRVYIIASETDAGMEL